MSRTLRRLIPSPAMIVALVALVMSLGGSAYATLMNGESGSPIPGKSIQNNSVTGKEIQNNSVTGKDIRRRSLRGRDLHKNSVGRRAIKESSLLTVPSAGGLALWAVVSKDGKFVRGNGLTAGNVGRYKPPSTGFYQLIFNSVVQGCSYMATLGNPDNAISVGDSQITASPHPTDPKGVLVRTANSANTVADRAFQLAVIC